MEYSPIIGQNDLLPDYHNYITFLKKVYRHEFRKNGFRRISTPNFEEKEKLEKAGFGNDFILKNETFDIRQNRTFGILRAYLDKNLSEKIQPIYFYYMGKTFEKKENFFSENITFGAEVIGEDDPILDAILIYINYKILCKIGLKNCFKIKINSTGIEKEKLKFEEELINFYESKKNILSQESKKLLLENPALILKSTNEDEVILNENAPKMVEKYLKKHSKEHFKKFREYLDLLEIPYSIDNSLVAENKTQTKSIWKFLDNYGNVISNGSRHNLVATNLGEKKEIPMSGFSVKIDNIIKLLKENNIKLRNKDDIDLFFVQLGDDAKKVVLPLSIKAREAGINTVVSLGTPSMKEQILKAQKSGTKYMVMVGIMEAKNGIFQVRNQIDGTQEEVKKEDLIEYIIDKIGKEKLDFYSPEKDLMI